MMENPEPSNEPNTEPVAEETEVNTEVKTQPSSEPAPESQDLEHLRKLFIGGLDHRTTDEKLKAYFEQWGEVVDVIVMKDPNTKRSRGFGFITYSKCDMIDAAQAARPHKLDGKVVESKRAVPRNQISAPEACVTVKRIFVANIKDEITEEELTEYFNKYGNVVCVNLITDKDTGKKKGFGFVEFDDYDSVDRACAAGTHVLRDKALDVKKAVNKCDMIKKPPNRSSNRNKKSSNGSDRNTQNAGNSSNDAWNMQKYTAGPSMNMDPNMAGGYVPPNWMQNGWQNGPVGTGVSPNMQMAPNSMNVGMYPGAMPPNNMNPMAMGGYSNMGPTPNVGMAAFGMSDPNMCNAAGTNMNSAMCPVTRMPNACGPVANNGAAYWNYPTATPPANWANPSDAYGGVYQQSYSAGPIRNGVASGTATRSAPYTAGTTTTTTATNYTESYTTEQTATRRF